MAKICGTTHHLCIFASFPSSIEERYSSALLSISPLGEEEKLTAHEHFDSTTFVLEDIFKKSWENVVALIGDNCPTYGAIAALNQKYFIECSSHRFQLAVK